MGSAPYKHTDLPKAYLTYPTNLSSQAGAGLVAYLFDIKKDTVNQITVNNETWYEHNVPLFIPKEIERIGGTIKKVQYDTIIPKKNFKINDNTKEIEVLIRTQNKSKDKKMFEARIRITGTTPEELLENLNGMKKTISKWGIKPRECMWSTGAWKEVVVKLTRKSDIVKREKAFMREQEKLKKVVEDMRQKINDLERPSIRKAIREEQKVMAGVLS